MNKKLDELESEADKLEEQSFDLSSQSQVLTEKVRNIREHAKALRAKEILELGLLKAFKWELVGTQMRGKVIYAHEIDALRKAAGWQGEHLHLQFPDKIILTLDETDPSPCLTANPDDGDRVLTLIRFMVANGLKMESVKASLQKHKDNLEKSLVVVKQQLAVMYGELT